MFKNIFKKVNFNQIVVNSLKSNKKLVEEIHHDFFTEVEKLLADAKISNQIQAPTDIYKKGEKLSELGFTGTKEAQQFRDERLNSFELQNKNKEKENLIKAINYFSDKYPFYKFITEESVIKICKMYGLIYGESKRYTGTVPDKNLKHIEDFKIDQNDELYLHIRIYGFYFREYINHISYSTYLKKNKLIEEKNKTKYINKYYEYTMKAPLEIVAPKQDFNMDGMELDNFKLSTIKIPDPVVLKPVFFNDKKYYLIVTAWGAEASDELVINHSNN